MPLKKETGQQALWAQNAILALCVCLSILLGLLVVFGHARLVASWLSGTNGNHPTHLPKGTTHPAHISCRTLRRAVSRREQFLRSENRTPVLRVRTFPYVFTRARGILPARFRPITSRNADLRWQALPEPPIARGFAGGAVSNQLTAPPALVAGCQGGGGATRGRGIPAMLKVVVKIFPPPHTPCKLRYTNPTSPTSNP